MKRLRQRSILPELPEMQKPFDIPPSTPAYFGCCAVCTSTIDLKQCSSCFSVAYCSEEHQHKHWEVHQEECTALAQRYFHEEGSYCKADREIKAGTAVLNLQPIMMCPSALQNRLPRTYQCVTCCGFYKSRTGELLCAKCVWPVCSDECASKPIHADNECKIFRKGNIRPEDKDIPRVILTLRCIMLQKSNPKAFDELLKASDDFHGPHTIRSQKASTEDRVLTKFLMRNKTRLEKWTHHTWTSENLYQFVKVIEACTVEMSHPIGYDFRSVSLESGITRCVFARYVLLEKLNIKRHCSPNMKFDVTFSPRLEETFITFRTTVDLSTNAILTVAWGSEVHYGTSVRQRILGSRFSQRCVCSRCTDPTENGTEFNTLRCLKCNKISIRPVDPVSKTSDWKCFTRNCRSYNVTLSQETVMSRVNKLTRELDEIERMERSSAIAAFKEYFRAKIDNTFGRDAMFHSSHFVIVKAGLFFARAVTQMLSELESPSDIDFGLVDIVSTLQTTHIDVYSKLLPGSTEQGGQLLYQQQGIMSTTCLKKIQWLRSRPPTLNPDDTVEINRLMVAVRDLQTKALECLACAAVGTSSHVYAKKLKQMLTALKNMFINRCLVTDGMDKNLTAQLYNMYCMVTSIPSVDVPDQATRYDIF